MSMISRNPTECSSSPTVPATITIFLRFTSSRISSSDNVFGSSGMTKVALSIVNGTRPFSSIRVPSAACITSLLITSQSTRPIFFPISSAANSATRFDSGSIIVSRIIPSPCHSASGLINSFSRSSLFSSKRTLTLSFSSSSSIKIIFSGFSKVEPPIRLAGSSTAPSSY